MANMIAQDAGPGLDLANHDGVMIAGVAVSKGDVMMVSQDIVDASNRYTTIIAPTTAELQHGLFCVCLEDQTTAGGNVRVRWSGRVLAKVDGGTTDIVVGAANSDPLVAANGARALVSGDALTANQKIIAHFCEGVSYTSATVVLKTVNFDGIHGFGNVL